MSMLFSFTTVSYANEETNDVITDSPTVDKNVTQDVTPPADTEESDETQEDSDTEIPVEQAVVRMSICSSFLGYFPTGHTWLYFENLTDEPVTVGIYELEPEKSVSVGTYCNQFQGFGIYYNIETYKGTPTDIHSMSTELTSEELLTVSEKIKKRNNWDLFLNCVFSATQIWNTVSETKAAYTFLPLLSMLDLRVKDGAINELVMDEATKEDIFKLRKRDGEYFLVSCSENWIV